MEGQTCRKPSLRKALSSSENIAGGRLAECKCGKEITARKPGKHDIIDHHRLHSHGYYFG